MVSVVLSAISGRDTVHPKPGGGGCDQAATIRPPKWEVIVLVVVIVIGAMEAI
ncbi:hypothetical protein [Parasphingorhabdus sp.]|uniref:hypothetical protein n=1 Tax=Parasphingorhabdus sp. TaxID=2709688 RepID=UPI00326663E8